MFPNEGISAHHWLLKDGGCLDMDAFPDCWEKRTHLERYDYACKILKKVNVLDFGCGMGYGSEMLLSSGNVVTAVDTSKQALEMARLRRGNLSIDLSFHEKLEDTWDFEGCTAFEVIEHLDNPEQFIQTVKTKHLICSVPVIPTVGRNLYHTHDFTVDSFKELVGKRFEIKHWWIQVKPYESFPSVAIIHGQVR